MLYKKISFAIAAACFIGSTAKSTNINYCDKFGKDNQTFSCRIKPNMSQPSIYESRHILNEKFSALPSCKVIDNRLKSLAKVAEVLTKEKNKIIRNEIVNQMAQSNLKKDNMESMNSGMVFTTRLNYSPIAKQYYYNFLNSKEIVNGNFNRPTITVNSSIDRYNTSTVNKQSDSKQTTKKYYNDTTNSIAIEYNFLDLQNFYKTKALTETAKASYEDFKYNAINDSLSSVSDYYELKKSILSKIITEAQLKATIEQVDRLRRLESNGLNSVLDISRANITEISQNINYTNAKSELSKNYEILLSDLNMKTLSDRNSDISNNLISTACWNKGPLESIEAALKYNSSVKKLKYNLKESKFTEKSIRTGMIPELTVGISYGPNYSWGDMNGTGSQDDYSNNKNLDAYISMNWSVYDFGQTEANFKAQANKTSSIENELKETVSQIESTIVTGMTKYISSTINIIDLTNGTLKAAKNYTKAIKAYKQGFLDQTDVAAIFTQLTSITQSLISNIGERNNAAIQIAAAVQQEGFDSINLGEELINYEN